MGKKNQPSHEWQPEALAEDPAHDEEHDPAAADVQRDVHEVESDGIESAETVIEGEGKKSDPP